MHGTGLLLEFDPHPRVGVDLDAFHASYTTREVVFTVGEVELPFSIDPLVRRRHVAGVGESPIIEPREPAHPPTPEYGRYIRWSKPLPHSSHLAHTVLAVRIVSTEGAPSPRIEAISVWTGSELPNWGGKADSNVFDETYGYLKSGAAYDPIMDTWRPNYQTSRCFRSPRFLSPLHATSEDVSSLHTQPKCGKGASVFRKCLVSSFE